METAEMTTNEIESAMGMIQRMLLVGAVFVAVGYVLLTVAGLQEAFDISSALSADSTKMWLKLGAVTHTSWWVCSSHWRRLSGHSVWSRTGSAHRSSRVPWATATPGSPTGAGWQAR